MADRTDSTTSVIFALAVLAAVVGVALYFVLPVLGTALGLIVAVSATGLATASVVGVWVAPVASISVAVIGVTAAVTVIKKVSDAAQEKPYEWGLPLLGVFAGFASSLSTDTALTSSVSKGIFGVITGFLIVVAGACYKRKGFRWKSVGVALYLIPPLALLGWSMLSHKQVSLVASFKAVDVWTWCGFVSILAIGAVIGILASLDPKKA